MKPFLHRSSRRRTPIDACRVATIPCGCRGWPSRNMHHCDQASHDNHKGLSLRGSLRLADYDNHKGLSLRGSLRLADYDNHKGLPCPLWGSLRGVDRSWMMVGMFMLLALFFSACGEVAPMIKAVQPIPTPLTTLPHIRYNVLLQLNVAYGPLAAEKLDLCLPQKASGARPGVILVHGGAWVGGDKGSLSGPCRLLAQQGFVAATVNYRLGVKSVPQTMWPAQLVDVQLAVRWLRAQADRLNLDSQRIGAWGSSAGGHLVTFLGSLKSIYPGDQAQLLANESPAVSWVVDEFGPVDLTANRDAPLNGAFLTLFGASYQQNPAAYHNASPIFDINSQSAPTLIIQGTHDTTVPPMQSVELMQALQKNNVPVLFVSYNGEHTFHGLTRSQRLAIMAQEVNYLIALEHP